MSTQRVTRWAWITAVTALTALAGCAASRLLPGPSLAGGGLNTKADRLILVTIDNQGAALLSEPGSTPHGYDAIGPYAVSDQAQAIAVALGRDYGLQEVRAWPIVPLGVQCLVFALPPQADRAALLLRLAADRRVRLAQPLQLFDALGGGGATGAQAGTTPATFGAGSGSFSMTAYHDP
jgi:hypothetical protein